MIPLPIHYAELETVYSQTVASQVHTIALTSPEGNEGVTTLAYALANRAAASGKLTLLVDLNMAAPSLHRWLGLEQREWKPNTTSAFEAIHEFSDRGLSILPAPLDITNALGFREPRVFNAQVKGWQERYQVVILDTTPITRHNRGNIPTEMICAACESTILVVMAARTTEQKIRQAIDKLASANAVLTGVVMNDKHNPDLAEQIKLFTERRGHLAPKMAKRIDRTVDTVEFFSMRT
ncbi:MAG: capsular biosynthesis protein [Pseudomonadota bacterium]|nr:capsular biosynthesis protein [Pseudomonadota bacterium]